ncbi:MAG: OmpA family protein [Acidobacteria bacterium]|nr:OmpA family protein [Acidobacteriota bacterium]
MRTLRALAFLFSALLPLSAGAQDLTRSLKVEPGMVIAWPVYGGRDTSGRLIGDYEDTVVIRNVDRDGIAFDFSMSYPARIAGHRVLRAQDLSESRRVSLFLSNGENGPHTGYSDLVRVSDAIFRDLRSGKAAGVEFDGGLPGKSIRKAGEEDLTVLLDEQKVKLHCIKAETDNGWFLWILDNENFPLVLQGSLSWKFAPPTITRPKLEEQALRRQFAQQRQATTHAILFAFNSAEIQSDSKPALDAIAALIRERPGIKIEIQGHTDNVGGADYNLRLSQNRAESVRNYLTQNEKLSDSGLFAKGYGSEQPIADNRTPEGRAQNRRVVIKEVQAH